MTRVLQSYGVVHRLQKEKECTYTFFFGDNHLYVGCSKHSHIHMRVSVVKSAYRFVQVNTWAVSTTCYFQGSLLGLRDGINKFEN
jgi:hypothetical protein